MGTVPVSSGGSSSARVSPESSGPPHCGQYRARFATRALQVGQLAMRRDPARRGLRPQLERAQCLCGTAAQRADERAVVLVGDLTGAVIELELLQGGERAVSFLGERESTSLELVRRVEAIVDGRWFADERQRDEDRSDDRDDCPDDETGRHASAKAPA